MLDLLKALATAATVVAIYRVGIAAFFAPATRWEDRVLTGLLHLAIAVCVAVAGGLLFVFPARSNPDRRKPLLTALPIQMLLWASLVMALLFAASYYVTCGDHSWDHGKYLNCS